VRLSATAAARRKSVLKAARVSAGDERVSAAARDVVEIFEATPWTVHFGVPTELRAAIRSLKNVLNRQIKAVTKC
jgi:hypothetical protein